MVEIKHKSTPIEKTIGLTNTIGGKIVAKNGSVVGHISQIYIHPKSLTIEAIGIEKGWSMDDTIGKNYIKSISEEGAMLSITPVAEYIGLSVLDSTGKNIGKVKQIKRSKKTNNILSIVVNRGMLTKDLIVTRKCIATADKKILLNVKVR